MLSFSQPVTDQCNSKQLPSLIFLSLFKAVFFFYFTSSIFPFLVFLLGSVVLHLALLARISHFTLNIFLQEYNYYRVCVRACSRVCVLGMTKVEEKLKAGRVKRPEGSGFSEEPQRRPAQSQSSKKDSATTSSGEHLDLMVVFLSMIQFAH